MRFRMPRWIAVVLVAAQALVPLRAYSMALPGFGAGDFCSAGRGADTPSDGGAPARNGSDTGAHCAACVPTAGAPPSPAPSTAIPLDVRDAPVATPEAHVAPAPRPRPSARAPPLLRLASA